MNNDADLTSTRRAKNVQIFHLAPSIDSDSDTSKSGTAEPMPESETSSDDDASAGNSDPAKEERQPGDLESENFDHSTYPKGLVDVQNSRALSELAEVL